MREALDAFHQVDHDDGCMTCDHEGPQPGWGLRAFETNEPCPERIPPTPLKENAMPKYRKRPVEIEARQLLGSDDGEPAREIARWCGGWLGSTFEEPKLVIPTLEGDMTANVGDWIVCGVQGEFYPCKPDIFEATYEPVDPAVTA